MYQYRTVVALSVVTVTVFQVVDTQPTHSNIDFLAAGLVNVLSTGPVWLFDYLTLVLSVECLGRGADRR